MTGNYLEKGRKEMEYILETQGITKVYGRKKVLDNVSIHVIQGDIYGLVGKNGAGKTTLMKIVSELANASSGSFAFFGRQNGEIRDLAWRRGILIENPGIYPEYSGERNLRLKCMAYGVKDKTEPKRLLSMVGLGNVNSRAVKKYSFGMKQRLGIAMAMVGNPDLIILDEPINGLDPQGISEVRDMIKKVNKETGATFIISSHILEELSKIATRYGIIHNGKLLEEITSEELEERCSTKVELITDNAAAAATVLESAGISDYKVLDNGVIYIYDANDRTADITEMMVTAGLKVYEITKKQDSFENYFINLIGKEA